MLLAWSERLLYVGGQKAVRRESMERDDRSGFWNTQIPYCFEYPLVGLFHILSGQSSVPQGDFVNSRVFFQSKILDHFVEVLVFGMVAADEFQSVQHVFDIETFLCQPE